MIVDVSHTLLGFLDKLGPPAQARLQQARNGRQHTLCFFFLYLICHAKPPQLLLQHMTSPKVTQFCLEGPGCRLPGKSFTLRRRPNFSPHCGGRRIVGVSIPAASDLFTRQSVPTNNGLGRLCCQVSSSFFALDPASEVRYLHQSTASLSKYALNSAFTYCLDASVARCTI